MAEKPTHIDLKRDEHLTLHWPDGQVSVYPIAYLRRMSPSAETRQLRAEMEKNPLTILPQSMSGRQGPIRALDAELVGNYAIRIKFSDGHDTGLYSWSYLREIAPDRAASSASKDSAPGDDA